MDGPRTVARPHPSAARSRGTGAGGVKILFATSEAVPLVKTGGLADVSGALPLALRREGADVRLLMPGYRSVLTGAGDGWETVADLALPPFPPARLLATTLPGGLPLLAIECPPLFDREGGLYQRRAGEDWPDNDIRFGLLSRVAALLAQESSPLGWRPDLLHCNDWQTGLAPAFLAASGGGAPTLLTIHNLAFQGIFQTGTLARVGLPWDLYRVDGVEYYGNISFLKAGIQFATRLTTVSPTYAREIQSEPLGFGLQGLLAWRSRDLTGILNGIDEQTWDPARDPHLPRRYDATSLPRKEASKRALQVALGLDADPKAPLLGAVSRLTHQKGLDLLIACIEPLLESGLQLAVLGSGEPELESAFTGLAQRYPGRAGVRLGFDEAFSHLVEAGADFFVMPSRFEPCGLNQMYSQRYGTPVVARTTGGLADSITDAGAGPGTVPDATGFLFRDPTPEALAEALDRAVGAFAHRRVWRRMQRAGMARDFSWDAAARTYLELYRSLV
ncbi:MAG: glycogen synthase GlgA [Betaproteobacteria bacterium]|nr:glycogen synthase GlgA [Betaproteobacteria bacterium]